MEISRNWAITHFLVFYGRPQNCQGACGCHLTYANVVQWVYNGAQGLLDVESSAILGLVGSNQFLLYPQYHSFKGCALPPSLCLTTLSLVYHSTPTTESVTWPLFFYFLSLCPFFHSHHCLDFSRLDCTYRLSTCLPASPLPHLYPPIHSLLICSPLFLKHNPDWVTPLWRDKSHQVWRVFLLNKGKNIKKIQISDIYIWIHSEALGQILS